MTLDMLGDFIGPQTLLGIFVFLTVATLAFTLMTGARVRGEVKRRCRRITQP